MIKFEVKLKNLRDFYDSSSKSNIFRLLLPCYLGIIWDKFHFPHNKIFTFTCFIHYSEIRLIFVSVSFILNLKLHIQNDMSSLRSI